MGSLRLFFTDPEDDTAIDSILSAFVEASGASWEDYANFDQDLATNSTIDEEWEAALLEKAKAGTSTEDRADTIKDENQEEEEEEVVIEKPILTAGTAISYLDDLSQSPELLDLISKSRTTIEKLMCNTDRLKQTKLSDYMYF